MAYFWFLILKLLSGQAAAKSGTNANKLNGKPQETEKSSQQLWKPLHVSDHANSKECQKFTSSLSSRGFSSSDFTIFNMASMQVKKQNHNLTNPCASTFTYLLSAKWHIRTQGFVYQLFCMWKGNKPIALETPDSETRDCWEHLCCLQHFMLLVKGTTE